MDDLKLLEFELNDFKKSTLAILKDIQKRLNYLEDENRINDDRIMKLEDEEMY